MGGFGERKKKGEMIKFYPNLEKLRIVLFTPDFV